MPLRLTNQDLLVHPSHAPGLLCSSGRAAEPGRSGGQPGGVLHEADHQQCLRHHWGVARHRQQPGSGRPQYPPPPSPPFHPPASFYLMMDFAIVAGNFQVYVGEHMGGGWGGGLPQHNLVVLLKLGGCTVDEIASSLPCSASCS